MHDHSVDDRAFADEIVVRLRSVLGAGGDAVALHEPCFSGNEWDYVKECLDTAWVSSVGKFVDRFERDLCSITGTAHAVAVVNGTAALHMCLKLAGVEPGDEVLVPALTFVATANAVRYCDAFPHFVDVEERTLGVSPAALRDHLASIADLRAGVCFNRRTGRRIRALVPMHTFGHPVDLDGLLPVATEFGLVVVEDAAESLGSLYRGRHTGNFGCLAALSFNGNKIVTTGGGGAILTNDPDLAWQAKHLTTTGKISHPWRFDHDVVAYNYRLPNLNAALGCAQLETLPEGIERKRELFRRYRAAFSGMSGVRVFEEPTDCRSNYWLQALLLDEDRAVVRDEVLAATNAAGLMTRPAWTPMHYLAPYVGCPRMALPVTESLARRIINVPSSQQLVGGGA
ncbi:MAG: LegC family aminotransferase [Betaproteobacteria bacterium]|nr:LegC family aminotransferase [Betaproteobacteria bacterium]